MKSSTHRIHLFKKAIESQRLDGFLVSKPCNLRYLFGFTGSAGLAWVHEQEALLLVDGRYIDQAQEDCSNCRTELGLPNPQAALTERWKELPAGRRIGIEARHLTLEEAERLRNSAAHLELVPCSSEVEKLRVCKDEQELECIRSALAIGSGAMSSLVALCKDGLSEIEFAGHLEFELRNRGGEGLAFDTIVAAGERSALPHALPSGRRIRDGELVLADCGTRVDGYAGDLTRVFIPSIAPPEMRRVIDVVWEAQQSAIRHVRPGIEASDVDRVVRNVFKRYDWDHYFSHSTGHGIGLEIHEAPSISSRSGDELQPGMVLTIEPGLYFPGRYGVRIEDVVLVTEDGCEVLSEQRKQFAIPD